MRLVTLLTVLLGLSLTMENQTHGQEEHLKENARIVFLGDSITQAGVKDSGYVTIIKRQVEKNHGDKNIEIIGAGISGNRVPDLQKRLEKDVLLKKPTTVVIYIGINDVWHSQKGRGTSKADFETGLNDIVAKIKANGASVVLCTPSVIGEKKAGKNPLDKMLAEYSAISRKVAEANEVKLLDLRRRFQRHLLSNNPLNLEKNILTTDGVHLNAAGNDFVAEQMAAALKLKYRSKLDKTVMRHIVLFKFNDDVDKKSINEIVEAFGKLPDKIDQIIDYEAGTNVSPEQLDQGYTHAFVVTFRDAAGRDAYLPHPAHKEFVELLDGKIDQVLVFDFED